MNTQPPVGPVPGEYPERAQGPEKLPAADDALVVPSEKILDLEARWRTEGIPESWLPRNIALTMRQIAAGTIERPKPSVGSRSDGKGLFYAGRLNMVFGRWGSAKSWAALIVAKQEIEAGNRVVWLDFEDDEIGTAERLVDLDADPVQVADRFLYLNAHEALTSRGVELLTEYVEEACPSLMVVDSGGEWMSLQNVDPNRDNEVAAFLKTYVGLFFRAGAAVVVLDHVPHEPKGRASGSHRKMAAVRGIAYEVEMVTEFGRGVRGKAKLKSAKDTVGHYPRKSVVAEIILDATTNPYTAEVNAPVAAAQSKPTALMEKVSILLEGSEDGLSKTKVRDAVPVRDQYIDQALAELVAGGWARIEPGPRGAKIHRSVLPYREGDDPLDDDATLTLLETELGAETLETEEAPF